MNKYQKLNESFRYANKSEKNGIASNFNGENHHHDDGDDDDEQEDEEYSALFLDNNYSNSNNSYNNQNGHHSNISNNNIIGNNSNNNHNHNHNNNRSNSTYSSNNTRGAFQQQKNFISNSLSSSSSSTQNSNSSTSNTTQTALVDAEESIMEVPLLHNDNDNNCDDDEPVLHQRYSFKGCRCNQPGFASNLKTKSDQEAKCKIILAITLCCIFMIIEFLGGYFAGSLAIMTDAAHLASDCISFIIGLVAIWLGSRKPDGRMSFGYKRMEVMGAVVSILGIWMLTATLVMMAIERIYSNDFDLDANTMMTISAIGILINIVMIFILHGSAILPAGFTHGHSHAHAHAHSHSHSDTQLNLIAQPVTEVSMCENGNGLKLLKHHRKQSTTNMHTEKNLNLRAAMIHVIGDLVQSIGVFLAAILIKFFPSAKFADPLCTILFSFIVIMTTTRLFKESVTILLDAVPKGVSVKALEMDLRQIDGVKTIHHLNVWQHTSNFNILMVHLVIDLLTDSNTVLDKATQLAHSSKYDIKHCTIQIERLAS